jgi:hypothetical protein
MSGSPGLGSFDAVLRAGLLIATVTLIQACSIESTIPLDRPDGWMTDERGAWWLPDVDTSLAFRNLETLETMGLHRQSPVYSADRPEESQMAVGRHRVIEQIRNELLPLYRNHPEAVDSVFWRFVADDILPAPREGDVSELIAQYRRTAYRTLTRHFHAPGALNAIGRDIPFQIPDSLRDAAAGRAVTFQIFVGADSLARGIRHLEGIHPVLDRIALRGVVQLEWQPAYLLRGGRVRPVDAWVRFGVRFPGSASENQR